MVSRTDPSEAGRRTRSGPRRRITGLSLAVLLALSPASIASAAEGRDVDFPGLATIEDTDVDAIVADIDQAVELATQQLEDLRSERLHLDVVLEQVGSDANAIRDWVATNTTWVPYRGLLRGAGGVLMDRTGSSLDRSLLLAEMLATAGYPTRLTRTELPTELAERIADAEASGLESLTPIPVLASMSEVMEHRDAVRRSSEALWDLLAPAAGDGGARAPVLESESDHWWVQAEVDGAWVDLDPAGLADEIESVAVDAPIDPSDIPDEMQHRLAIRVVAERSNDDGITRFTPFEYDVPLGGSEPNPWFEVSFDSTIAETPERELDLDEMAAAISHWRPAVSSAAGDLVGDWFTTDGRLEIPSITPTRDAFGDADSALGGLGSDEEAHPQDGKLTAIWLEFETSGPGLEPRLERRDLIRQSDPESTDIAAALLGSTSVLVQTAAIHPDAFYQLLLENTVAARNALIALTFMAAGREDERILPALTQASLAPTNLYAIAMARTRWGAEPGALFIGRPNVWAEHQTFERTATGLVDGFAVDIVHNDIAARARTPAEAFRARLEQGVLDTLVEHALIDSPAGDNTFVRFDAAVQRGERWRAFTDPAELRDAGGELPPVDVERMRESIEAGHVVVTDLRLVDGVVSWWRIDPLDGRTLGMGINGWGSVGERAGTHQVPGAVLRAFQRMQGSTTAQGGRNLARQAARYARNNPTPEPGTMTVFELVGGVIQRIYIL